MKFGRRKSGPSYEISSQNSRSRGVPHIRPTEGLERGQKTLRLRFAPERRNKAPLESAELEHSGSPVLDFLNVSYPAALLS
jgi:hypothetical protein